MSATPASPETPSTPLSIHESAATSEYWIFGYGSLLYKPPPHTDLKVPGYVQGYVRRFWQSSNDHRGTPEAPGRVVTLITHDFWKSLSPPDVHPHPPSGKTWGVAYRIKADKVEEVKDYLDLREQNGYSVHTVPFIVGESSHPGKAYVPPNTVIPCVTYIGTPENEAFIGPKQTPEELARHILASRGPSGENREYLYNLSNSLLELSPDAHDHHIEELVRIARELEKDIPISTQDI